MGGHHEAASETGGVLDTQDMVPHDYIWLVPATLMVLLFVVLMACLHHFAPAGRRVFSQVGLVFAALCAAVISAHYYLQPVVVQTRLPKRYAAARRPQG